MEINMIINLDDKGCSEISKLRDQINSIFTRALKGDPRIGANEFGQIMILANKLKKELFTEPEFCLDLSKKFKICCKLCHPIDGHVSFKIIRQYDDYFQARRELQTLKEKDLQFKYGENLVIVEIPV